MPKTTGSTYEIVFRSGAKLTLENVNLDLEFQNRRISKFNVSGNSKGDELKFIDIGEIIAVNQKQRKGRWRK